MKACIPYIVRNIRIRISKGFVRADWSTTLTPVKISQAAHMGKDRIFASSKSVVWVYLQCFAPRSRRRLRSIRGKPQRTEGVNIAKNARAASIFALMSNAAPSTLLPSNYCKYMYFVFRQHLYLSPDRPNSRPPPITARDSRAPDDHDRDDGVAESPYMLIQGPARLTN
jgi:hypothetical protein